MTLNATIIQTLTPDRGPHRVEVLRLLGNCYVVRVVICDVTVQNNLSQTYVKHVDLPVRWNHQTGPTSEDLTFDRPELIPKYLYPLIRQAFDIRDFLAELVPPLFDKYAQ